MNIYPDICSKLPYIVIYVESRKFIRPPKKPKKKFCEFGKKCIFVSKKSQKHRKMSQVKDGETHIIPTKERPTFIAECDHFGFIAGPYLRTIVEGPDGEGTTTDTFGTDFTDSIVRLHGFIENNEHMVKEYPKAKYNLYMVDGSWDDKMNHAIHKKVYTITTAKAKKLLNI